MVKYCTRLPREVADDSSMGMLKDFIARGFYLYNTYLLKLKAEYTTELKADFVACHITLMHLLIKHHTVNSNWADLYNYCLPNSLTYPHLSCCAKHLLNLREKWKGQFRRRSVWGLGQEIHWYLFCTALPCLQLVKLVYQNHLNRYCWPDWLNILQKKSRALIFCCLNNRIFFFLP